MPNEDFFVMLMLKIKILIRNKIVHLNCFVMNATRKYMLIST